MHKKEGARYAIKVVENESLSDEENLEALETEVRRRRRAAPARAPPRRARARRWRRSRS